MNPSLPCYLTQLFTNIFPTSIYHIGRIGNRGAIGAMTPEIPTSEVITPALYSFTRRSSPRPRITPNPHRPGQITRQIGFCYLLDLQWNAGSIRSPQAAPLLPSCTPLRHRPAARCGCRGAHGYIILRVRPARSAFVNGGGTVQIMRAKHSVQDGEASPLNIECRNSLWAAPAGLKRCPTSASLDGVNVVLN